MKGIEEEIDFQSRTIHPNIVKYYSVQENENSYYFIMEYDNNDLY